MAAAVLLPTRLSARIVLSPDHNILPAGGPTRCNCPISRRCTRTVRRHSPARARLRVKAVHSHYIAARIRFLSHTAAGAHPARRGTSRLCHRDSPAGCRLGRRRTAYCVLRACQHRDQRRRSEVKRVRCLRAIHRLLQPRSTSTQGQCDRDQLVRQVVKAHLAAVIQQVAIRIPSVRLTVDACQLPGSFPECDIIILQESSVSES